MALVFLCSHGVTNKGCINKPTKSDLTSKQDASCLGNIFDGTRGAERKCMRGLDIDKRVREPAAVI